MAAHHTVAGTENLGLGASKIRRGSNFVRRSTFLMMACSWSSSGGPAAVGWPVNARLEAEESAAYRTELLQPSPKFPMSAGQSSSFLSLTSFWWAVSDVDWYRVRDYLRRKRNSYYSEWKCEWAGIFRRLTTSSWNADGVVWRRNYGYGKAPFWLITLINWCMIKAEHLCRYSTCYRSNYMHAIGN